MSESKPKGKRIKAKSIVKLEQCRCGMNIKVTDEYPWHVERNGVKEYFCGCSCWRMYKDK